MLVLALDDILLQFDWLKTTPRKVTNLTDLVHALESFNRKERNLLLRAALGHKTDKPLQLDADFCALSSAKLNIANIPSNAWWATDYHISWLAGALAMYFNDTAALTQGRLNLTARDRNLVEGNQEDIDLVIAFGQDLVLVEAKAFGAWSNAQIDSKLDRLNLLLDYYNLIKLPETSIRFHFVLISPRRPEKLTAKSPPWSTYGPELAWVRLDVEATAVSEVTRCHADGTIGRDGSHWRILTTQVSQGGFLDRVNDETISPALGL